MDFFRFFLAGASFPGAIFYNLSQILLIVSMSMRNVTWLRLLAVASGALALAYRVFVVPDVTSAFWQAMFLAVNLVQLAILWSERLRSRLSDDQEFFIAHVVPSVHRSLSRRLVKVARHRHLERNERLTEKGEVVPDLIFILAGSAEVSSDGKVVGHCQRGEFVGEMSFVTGNPASADVVAETPVSCLAFDRTALAKTLAASNELRHALEASFNRNLVDKLASANSGPSRAALSHPE